jgi:hypothetical protein
VFQIRSISVVGTVTSATLREVTLPSGFDVVSGCLTTCTLAPGDDRERARAEHRGEDVRALGLGRRHVPAVGACVEPYAQHLVAAGLARVVDVDPGLRPGVVRVAAGQAPQRGPREQVEGHDRRHRVAGQPEDDLVAARPEPGRLARLERHAPEVLVDAELGQRGLDVVVRTDRHTARDHDHVGGLQRPAERLDRVGAVVAHDLPRDHARARALGLGRERVGVRVADLPGGERAGARLDQLVAGGQDGHPGSRAAQHVGAPQCGQRAQLGRAQVVAGAEHPLAGGHVLTGAADVRALLRRRHDHAPVGGLRALDAHDGDAALGYGGAGRYAHGLAGAERFPRGRARAGLADYGQVAAAGVADHVAVERRRIERRHVLGALDVLGQHAPERVGERHALGLERPHRGQHDLSRGGDVDQVVGHTVGEFFRDIWSPRKLRAIRRRAV